MANPAKVLALLWILCGFSILIVIALAVFGLSNHAAGQISRRLDTGSRLTLETIRPSSYYLTIEYKISGDSELRHAAWRLKGNEVVVSK